MDNIHIIAYVLLILTSYTWTMHYEYPPQEGEYDEELIEDSDEMFHDGYGVETYDDYSSHRGSNHDGPNDEKHEEHIGDIHDHQHLKNNHEVILDEKGIETKAEHDPHEDESNEDIAKAKHVENVHVNEEHLVESEHDDVSDRRQIGADDKHFPDQRGANKHPIHIAHDENNDDHHHIFSGGKHIAAHEKHFPDELGTLKHTTEIVHDENSIGTYDLISVRRKVDTHEKHFLDQREDNKYTTQITHDENSNGEYDIISGERKIETHEKNILDQQGTNRHTTRTAHDENKDGNEKYPNRLEHDVIVGGIEAHEEHVPSHSGSTEHTTQTILIEFLDDSKKYIDKSQNSAAAGGSRIQSHRQHIINQDGKERNILKIENENPNTNEDQFFNRRGHGIILGGNKTEIAHLLVVEIKDLKNAKPLEHTDGNERNINDHEVVLDGSCSETRENHATNIALNREDSKESIKEDFDNKEEHLRKPLQNTTAFENTEYLKKSEHAEFSSESKDSKIGSEHAAVVKNKQVINEKNYHFSNDPVLYEPKYFGFYDYYDLLSQVEAFKGTHKTESPSVNFDQKFLNIKEEITPPGTTFTLFPSISLSPFSHSITKYSRLDLTSNLEQNMFHIEKTNQRAKIHSVTPQPYYSNGNYLKEAHRMELTSMPSKNSENDKAKYAPLLITSSQFPSTSSLPISLSLKERVRARNHQNTPYQTVTHENTPYQAVTHQNTPYKTVTHQNTPYQMVIHQNTPYQTKTHQNTPYQTKTHQNTPYQTKTHQNTPYQTVTHQNTPYQTVTHQNTPYQTVTHQNAPHQTVTHQNTSDQTVTHQNNLHQSKTTQSIKINTEPFTIKYATSNYLKKRFKTPSTSDFNHPVSYETKVTSPISIRTEFYSSSSSSLNSQDVSENSRRLHLLPYLHLHQTKTTQKTKIRTTFSPLSTLKPMLNYVIMCKTINATIFDSQPLVFRRRSNPVHKFSIIQRISFPKEEKKFVSSPQPPTMALYKVQKVEIGPRDYTVCDYHYYTTKSSLYQARNSNKSSFRHISTPFKISSNDYSDSGETPIRIFVPKILNKLKNANNSENLHDKTFNINYRRKVGIHLHNQNWLVTKNHYSPASNVHEYVIAPRTSASKSKQFFTQATVTPPTFNRKHKTVKETLSGPISEFVTRNFKSTAHKKGFYQVITNENYKILTEKPITSMQKNYPFSSNSNAHFSSTQHEDHEKKSSTVSEYLNKKSYENKKILKYAQTSFEHYTFPRTRKPISMSTIYSSTNTPVYLSISYPETLLEMAQGSFATKHYIPAIMTTPVKISMFRPSSSDTEESSILKTTYPSYSMKRNIQRIAQKAELYSMYDKSITYIPHTVTKRRNKILVKATSNYSQTTASLHPYRAAKNVEEEAIFPSYTTNKSIRRTTLEPKESISHNNPIPLFPDSVIAKRNRGFRKSNAHYSFTPHPYSSTSKTERRTGHAIFPSYSTEDNNFRISQESEGFTSYNKPITYFSYSVYGEKERTKNKDKTATFSQQEPLTNAQNSSLITTSTESTNSNANIYSTGEGASISNKKHISFNSEDQLKRSENYQQTTPSVYHRQIEEYGSHFTSMKHKPFITYSSIKTPEKVHSTILPLVIRTLQADKKEYLPNTISYETTNNAREEIHPRNLKQKELPSARDYKIANTATKEEYSHSSNQKPTMLMTPSTIRYFDYNSRTTRPSTVYELKRGKTKAYLILPILRYQTLVPQKPQKVFVSNPPTTLSLRFKNKPTTVDDKNKETDILLSHRVSEKDNIRHLSDIMLHWLCYRSIHLGENNRNCSFNQQQTEQITNNFGKTMKPAIVSTSMHYTTDMIDKEYSPTTASSNILQTTALSYPPRRTINIEVKVIYPFYSTEQSIRQNILESEESTSQNKPVTLFSLSVIAKRNQGFRKSTAHYSVPPQLYSSTSKTKPTTGSAMLPSYSTEQNTYRISQESEEFTTHNKMVSNFSHSVPAEKRRTKYKKIKTTFSQRESFTNAPKSSLSTTSTESTNSNANIYSTGEGASISNKKHISFISEDQLKTSENYQQTTPSVYHRPIEEQSSHFTPMKYKPFITYSSITTSDKLHSTTILPLLHRTPLADNEEYSPKTISYETTNNAREEIQPRSFKRKYLPQDPKKLTSKYLPSSFSAKSSTQTIDENKSFYPTLFQNTVPSTKQLATIYSLYSTEASTYTRDYKIANTVNKESHSLSSNHKPTILMTPSTIKSFNYYSRFTPPSSVYDLKRGKTKAYLTLPILHYQSLIRRKPPNVFVSNPSTSAFTHPFINKPTTVDNRNNKETDMLVKNIQPRSNIMLYWLCYRRMYLDKNNQNFNFSQQQTETIMNSYCKVMKPTVASTSMQHTTNMTDKDLHLDTFKSYFASSILNLSTVSPSSYLSIGSRVLEAKHSKGQINNAQKPEEYVSLHSKSRTRLPLRMKVDNFQSNYPHLTMTKSDFLASPLFLKKSETYKSHYSNKATEAYSSFTPEPSDSSTIQLHSSNIDAHKFSILNSFNHQARYISKYFPINIKTASSSNHYTVSPYNRKNTLKMHDIHKTIFSRTQQNYLATKLYIPYMFKQRITTSSSTVSSVQYQPKSNISKFSPRFYTSILATKNGNPTIKFPSYIERQPTKSTSLDSIYKTRYNRNPNNSKFASRLYTTNFSTTQNGNTTTKLPSYIERKSTKSTSLDSIYTTTHKQSRNIAKFSSKLYLTNLPTALNNYIPTNISSYITRQPTKSTSRDSNYKTTYKQSPSNSKFSTAHISRRQKGYLASKFSSYITRQPTKSTSLDSVYKTTDAQNPDLISKSFTILQKTTPLQKQNIHSLIKHLSYLKTTQPIDSTSFNFIHNTLYPKLTDNIVKPSDTFRKTTPSLKENYYTTTENFIQYASKFLMKSTLDHSLDNSAYSQTSGNIFKFLNKIDTTSRTVEHSNYLNTKYLKHLTVKQWSKPTSFTSVYITHRQKLENVNNHFGKFHPITISSKHNEFSTIKPIPHVTAKFSMYSTIYTPKSKDISKLPKYPSMIIRDQQHGYLETKLLDYFGDLHPTVGTTDSLYNTENSLKSDKVLRYTKNISENSLSTEPSNQSNTKSLYHLTNSVPNTRILPKPETVLENTEFYKRALSKEVSAIEKFNYFSTKLPLYLRLKETIRRKSSEGRFTVNMPEFNAEDQNKPVPTQQSAPDLNVAQQNGEDLGLRRGRPGGGGGRGRPGIGRSGFKTSAGLRGRPTKTKD